MLPPQNRGVDARSICGCLRAAFLILSPRIAPRMGGFLFTMNYIRYNKETETYSFRHLPQNFYQALTDKEKVEYLEQQMLWTLDEDWEKLHQLMDDAKRQALGEENPNPMSFQERLERYGDRD